MSLKQAAMPVATKLQVLWGTRWFFNRHPVVAFLIALGMSPLFMWSNDYLIVWGRILPLSYQWLSALFDSFLAVGIGVMLWNARKVNYSDFPRFVQGLLWRTSFHVGLAISGFGFSMLHMYKERESVPVWWGPNGLWHNFLLFPFLWYVCWLLLIVTVGIVLSRYVVDGGWLRFTRALFTLAVATTAGAGWVWAGSTYDAEHQIAPSGYNKQEYSNPPYPYCGGAITVHICGPAKRRAPIK